MLTVLLAGGRGTRMAGRFGDLPKPLVPIGGRPIIHHIMTAYAERGFTDFIIALGYQGGLIRDSCARLPGGEGRSAWRVELVETGLDTATGGRIKRLGPWLGNERFMLTWGDGLSDVDPRELLDFHLGHGRLMTLTAVHPPSRFGYLDLDGERVRHFAEKPRHAPGWINGAFFVVEPEVLDWIEGDDSSWEQDVMPKLAAAGELMAWRHEGFWRCMDTPAEHAELERLWSSGQAPWRTRA